MIIDAVIFMSEFRIVLYENDVNRRIVDLCFFGSSAHLPVCLLCQMIAFYVVEIGKVKEVYGVVIEKAVVAEAAVKAEAVKVEAKAEKQVKETKASPDFFPGGKRHSKLEKTHKPGLSKARNICAEKKSRAQEAPIYGPF